MANQLPPLLARVLGREDEFFGRQNDVLSDLVVVLVCEKRLGCLVQCLQSLFELLGLLIFISDPSSIGGGSVGWHVVGGHGLTLFLDFVVQEWASRISSVEKMKRDTAERASRTWSVYSCLLRLES